MNILVDLRSLQTEHVSGVTVFGENLVQNLCEHYPEERFYLWTNSLTSLPESFSDISFPNATHIHTKIPNIILTLLSSLFRIPKIDTLVKKQIKKMDGEIVEFDIAFIPDPRPFPVSTKCKKVCLFHDLSPLHFPQTFSLKTRIWHRLVRFTKEARESTHIFTPSRHTKDDIVQELGVSSEKISVIGAGVSEALRPITDDMEKEAVRKKYKLPENFFLTLSTLEPRKNISALIEAFCRFQKIHDTEDFFLVIAGTADPKIFAHMHIADHPNILFPGHIEETEKAALFSSAIAFVYPSLFEGFGMPVLEAMACGVPVLSSQKASLPEVYGDAALSFDPTSISDMTDALENMYVRKNMRKELREKGFQRASSPQFHWTTVARKVMAICAEIEDMY